MSEFLRRQPVPQRKGTRSGFLRQTEPKGRLRALERERYAYAVWQDPEALDRLAASARLVVAHRGVERPVLPTEFVSLDPLELIETRRPASWTERINRTTLVAIKGSPSYHVWAESLNERSVIWDVLLGLPDARVVTQAVRIAWSDEHVGLQHYPDILWWSGEDRALIDVTSGGRVRPTLSLLWELTARACDDWGWAYELRVPMPPQRARNLQAIDLCTDADASVVSLACRILQTMPEAASLNRILLNYESHLTLDAVLHLVGNGLLNTDLDRAIVASSWLDRKPVSQGSDPRAARGGWFEEMTERPRSITDVSQETSRGA